MKARAVTPLLMNRFAGAVYSELDGQAAFTEFLALEACVSHCEVLAGELSREGRTAALAQISECIAACGGYVAALARESVYAGRLASLCAEVCEETARQCAQQGGEAARSCAVLCRTCQRLLQRRVRGAVLN